MSTTKLLGCLALSCAVSLVAQAQDDTPPSLPDFTAPPKLDLELKFPELPGVPKATKPATPVTAPRTPAVVGPRPRRLSVEQTANLPKQVQNIIDFYGGATSARALAQLPQRPSSGQTRPNQPRQMAKPFQGRVDSSPTISPYLNLFREENTEDLPNYFTYVRPAQRQRQANARARQRINTLQNEVQQVSYEQSIQQSATGSVPGTGHGTRYFNTTGFYPSTRRLR